MELSPGCVQCTRMRGAVNEGEATAHVCRVQRARDRALACDSRARSEALTSTLGKCASDSSSTRECKPSHTHVIRLRVLPYL